MNPRPEDGLSSSLRVGLGGRDGGRRGRCRHRACSATSPRSGPTCVRAVVAAAETAPVPIVRPRYAADGAPNPVVRPAGRLAARRGRSTATAASGPLLAARPDLVLEVPVDGANPDVDTAADLARLEGVS